MKKSTAIIIVVLIIMVCVACNSRTKTVSTDGSTSVEKVIGFLSEAYMEENRDIRVTYNPTGSGAGIQATANNRCDIGLASRELKAEEKAALDSTVLAIDGIAIIVNTENSVADLTMEQVRKIYTGEIKNWRDVGGKDGVIVLIGREAASGTRDGFEAVTDTQDKCSYTRELTSAGDVIQTVAGNPNAIGYTSLAAVKNTVKTVKVDGIAPSKESIQSGDYKIRRNFLMVTSKNRELTDAAKKFFQFAVSKKAEQLIEMAGAIPVLR